MTGAVANHVAQAEHGLLRPLLPGSACISLSERPPFLHPYEQQRPLSNRSSAKKLVNEFDRPLAPFGVQEGMHWESHGATPEALSE